MAPLISFEKDTRCSGKKFCERQKDIQNTENVAEHGSICKLGSLGLDYLFASSILVYSSFISLSFHDRTEDGIHLGGSLAVSHPGTDGTRFRPA